MKFLLLSLLAVSSAFAAETPLAPTPAPPAPHLTNAFGAYNLEMFDRPALDQVNLLSRLGYDGIVASTWGKDSIAQIREFLTVPAIREGKFSVYAILWTPNFDQGYDAQWLAKLIPLADQLHCSLWVAVFADRAQHKRTVTMLQAVAEQCALNGVPMVLYPHYGSSFADLEEGLALLDELGRPGVKLSIHLCHELMAGNVKRWAEIIAKAAPHLVLASINGVDPSGIGQENWTRKLILPLDQGPYDVHPYVEELVRHGYRGPFLLQTYGLRSPPEEHLASSIKRWREISADVAIRFAPEASPAMPTAQP